MHYEDRQWFPLWAFILLVSPLAAYLMTTTIEGGLYKQIFALAIPALLLLTLNLLALNIRITHENIEINLGILFPMLKKGIPLEAIQETRCVSYRPLRDAGGWGYRWGRFEGQPCRFYTAQGNQGVLLVTEDTWHIIGAKQPEALRQAIDAARH